MSTVRAARSLPSEPNGARVDVQSMQDLLYDILATGVDTELGSAPTEAVERFLHEHARSAKSPEEFLAFFARHGLTVSGRSPRPIADAALPPIRRVSQEDAQVLKFPVELSKPDAGELELDVPFAPHALSTRASGLRGRLVWAAFGAALLALGALGYVGYVGYATAQALEQRLLQTHAAAERDRQAIAALEHNQVDLESNVAASAQLLERMDQKSDLILQSVQPPPPKPRRH